MPKSSFVNEIKAPILKAKAIMNMTLYPVSPKNRQSLIAFKVTQPAYDESSEEIPETSEWMEMYISLGS
ncbi:MAG: hypothetical protein P3W91_005330 [Fervidobacterium sp.]|nr:hypothetical protein [Fervidobacterium sp.]